MIKLDSKTKLRTTPPERFSHAYYGEDVDGRFTRTSATALCGDTDDMPKFLGERPPLNLCPICRALSNYRELAGL